MRIVGKYDEDFKKEVLEYAREHGVTAAEKEYGVPYISIYIWNEKDPTYEVREHKDYTEDFKKEVLGYAKWHGVSAAVKEYGVSHMSIYSWNKKDPTFGKNSYGEDFKKEVLEYVREHGVPAAAKEYNVSDATIYRWNEKGPAFGKKYKDYPEEFKLEVLDTVRDLGVMHTAMHFHIDVSLISKWNKRYKVYEPRGNAPYTSTQKKTILKRALEAGYQVAAEEFSVSKSVIILWNEELHIIPAKAFSADVNNRIMEKAEISVELSESRKRMLNGRIINPQKARE